MRRKLSSEITPQSLMYMREEEGLSNREIAERLEISEATVVRYIGRAKRERKTQERPSVVEREPEIVPVEVGMPVVAVTEQVAAPRPTPAPSVRTETPQDNMRGLEVVAKTLTLNGEMGYYDIDLREKVVTLRGGRRRGHDGRGDVQGVHQRADARAFCDDGGGLNDIQGNQRCDSRPDD